MDELNQEPTQEVEQKEIKSKTKKRKVVGLSVLCVVLLCVAYTTGRNIQLNEEALKVAADQRLDQDKQYQKKKGELKDLKLEISKNKSTLNAINIYKKNKEDFLTKLKENKAKLEELNGLKDQISTLDAEIAEKKETLKKLNGDVIKAKGNPVNLPAGQFTVGKDINAGRYKVTGDSNFVVYSASGQIKVNTILGGGIGVDSYVCDLASADQLECHGADTFTPIE